MELLTDAKFWVAVGFVIFVAAVFKPARAAMVGMLDARARRIAEELARAARLRSEAESLLASYQQQYDDAVKASEAIVRKAHEDAERYAKQMEHDLTRAMEKRRALAEQKIASAEARAVREVEQHIIDIAVSAARELIKDKIAQGQGEELIKLATADLQRKLH